MARVLNFQLGDSTFFAGEPSRIDRARLYGRVEQIATDKYGTPLEKAALDEDGATVISAAGMGYQSDDGRWLPRGALQAVDRDGRPLESSPSSFDGVIRLAEEESVDLDEYHLHEIETLYLLDGDLSGAAERCREFFERAGRLYCFPFLHREGYESYTAFLIPREDKLFLAAGRKAAVRFVGKKSSYVIDEVFEDEEDEADALDFAMS